MLSGALHVDGFLDASDALLVETSVERRLEILKDPRVGSFAVAAFAVVSAFSVAALQALDPRTYPFALAFAGGIARLGAVANAYRYRRARSAASARFFARPPSMVWLAISGTLACFAGSRAQRQTFASAATVAFASYILGGTCARRLGGVLVGDVYGFLVVILESLTLTSCAIFMRHRR